MTIAAEPVPWHHGFRSSAVPRWAGRVGFYLVTVLFIVTVNFCLPRALPGDPVAAVLSRAGSEVAVDDATRRELVSYYGLDRPLVAQYGSYLRSLAQGDLGTSITYRAPVRDLLAERLPWTLLLVVSSMAVGAGVALVAGVHAGWRRGRSSDRGLVAAFTVVGHFPSFFLASMAVFVFAAKLGWFPVSGGRTPFAESSGFTSQVLDIAHHLVLPAAVLALVSASGLFLVMRGGMVSELGADHLVLGRAKGLPERRLKYGYAARNALLPVVTAAGLQFTMGLAGAILVESVFAYPGTGRLAFEAVADRDYPTIQGFFVVVTLTVVTVNLLVDLLYRRLDPRARS